MAGAAIKPRDQGSSYFQDYTRGKNDPAPVADAPSEQSMRMQQAQSGYIVNNAGPVVDLSDVRMTGLCLKSLTSEAQIPVEETREWQQVQQQLENGQEALGWHKDIEQNGFDHTAENVQRLAERGMHRELLDQAGQMNANSSKIALSLS